MPDTKPDLPGAKYVKPDVEVLVSYIGGYNSFNNPKKAEQITNEPIRENTDVFYHAAGASNRGIVNSAKKYGKYVIEVDSYSDWQNKEVVIASAVKNIDVAVYDIIKKLTDNTLENKTYIYGAKEEGIGIVIKGRENRYKKTQNNKRNYRFIKVWSNKSRFFPDNIF